MNKSTRTVLSVLIALLLITAGIQMLVNYKIFVSYAGYLVIAALAIMALRNLVDLFTKPNKLSYGLLLLVEITFLTLFAIQPYFYFLIYPQLYGWWALINGIALSISFVIAYRDKLPFTFWTFLNAIINLAAGVLFIFTAERHLKLFSLFGGIYLIYLGVGSLMPLIFPKWWLSVKLPLSLSIFVTPTIIAWVNRAVKTGKMTAEDLAPKKNDKYPLEVFVYIKPKGKSILGHVNIAFQGKTYAYGAYDYKTRRLFGLTGDGVLEVTDRDAYVNQMVVKEGETAVCFGIDLDPAQIRMISDRIEALMKRTIPFSCDYEIKEQGLPQPYKDPPVDILSRLYSGAKQTKFYHFIPGQFHTYSLIFTNCVYLTNYLIKNKNLALFDTRGLITPGNYFGFLNEKYEMKDPTVVSRQIFRHLK